MKIVITISLLIWFVVVSIVRLYPREMPMPDLHIYPPNWYHGVPFPGTSYFHGNTVDTTFIIIPVSK